MTTVELAPYNLEWHEQFLTVVAEFATAPSLQSLPLCHIGSTAIPGLIAKDVIDVQLGVVDITKIIPLQNEHTDLGYMYLPQLTDHIPAGYDDAAELWAKQFWTTKHRRPKVNLHIRQIDNPNWRFALLFRDYLRANTDVAADYAASKIMIAQTVDASQYSMTKDPIIDVIMVGAEEWAASTNWKPVPNNE